MPARTGSARRKRKDDWAWDSATRRRVRPRTSYVPRGGPRVRRPSLQYVNPGLLGSTAVHVADTNGEVRIITGYSRGSDEQSRHTNETITYKLSLDLYVTVDTECQKYVGKGVAVAWLVYDAQPTGEMPAASTIFPHVADMATAPCTWKVGREVCHRFVVKRRWVITLETNGRVAGTVFQGANGVPPCNRTVYFHKFCKRLGVRTEWKNTSGGSIGDIKTGAPVHSVRGREPD
ncbi:capsid protein [Rice latent virus 2]|uniref:Capsid protein n=1 Tax=Rice latent virus 2 TaxID=2012857 RepID=A0A2D0WZE0_9GEMI|nr:capsid protein [Rice latent virus 2]ASA49173.1 capsid protein [Rice latent virus 2]